MNRRPLILLLATVVAGAVVALLFRDESPPPVHATPTPATVSTLPLPAPIRRFAPAPSTPQPAASPLLTAIEALLAKLLDGRASSVDLAALRNQLLHADPSEAMAAIAAFLASGHDAPTGRGFGVGPNGSLNEAPTLRTFLLDLLGQIAQGAGSDLADSISRQILNDKTTPEEWALALRNVAWSEPTATAFLAGKMRDMLSYQPWTSQASPGLLEAFDIVVYTGDSSFIPTLAAMATGGLPEVERAAVIALDRLSETSPLAVMSYLNSNPGQLAALPFVRADYFAKADLGQAQQVSAVENYLDRVDVSLDEKTKLIGALATPASFVTDGLLTPPTAPDNSAARLQALPVLYQNWLVNNRFPALQGPIEQVLGRLSQ